jgi:hypothetical protein
MSADTIGQFMTATGYAIAFIVAITYLPITKNDRISFIKNIIFLIAFGGFSVNHALTGLEQLNYIQWITNPFYKVYREFIHSIYVIFGYLIYEHSDPKYGMTLFHNILMRPPQIAGLGIPLILLILSHIYLVFAMIFNLSDIPGYLGLMTLFAMNTFNGENSPKIKLIMRIAALLLSLGYFAIVFL